MNALDILVIGGGIGGPNSAIALGNAGYAVTVIERDPTWSVYGLGITAYRARRFERCRFIVEKSLDICDCQIGKGPPVDNAVATAEMFAVTA
jgi:flavin-dependent dehydrogenase